MFKLLNMFIHITKGLVIHTVKISAANIIINQQKHQSVDNQPL